MAITYSISGGVDAALFKIDATTGVVTFKVAPDFENPGDANKDNVYEVTVKATDPGGASTTQALRVTVTDVIENTNLPPEFTSSGAVNVAENTTSVITVVAVDPDGGVTPPIEPPPSGSYDDGAANAPTGAANAPTLLNGYAKRPPWKVAGVDYRVGIQTGKVLKDWRSNNPAGTTVSGNLLRINAANVVIDGLDFTLGTSGNMIYEPGATNVTVTNCRFGGSGKNISFAYISCGNGLTVRNCEFLPASSDGSSLVSAGGTVIMEYNYATDYPQHAFETGSSINLTYRYNFFQRGGTMSGSHFNLLQQTGNGVSNTIKMEFNTFHQNNKPGDGEGPQFDLTCPGNSGTLVNCSCSYNCFLAKSGANVSYWIHGPALYQSSDTCNVTNRTRITGSLKFYENYFDITGAYGEFYGNSLNADCDLQGNVNAVSGAAIAKTAFNTCEL